MAYPPSWAQRAKCESSGHEWAPDARTPAIASIPMGASRSLVRSRIVFGVLGALVVVLLVGLVAPSLSMPSAVHVDGLAPVSAPARGSVVPEKSSGAPRTDPRAPDASGDNGASTSVAIPGDSSPARRQATPLAPLEIATPTSNVDTPPTFVGAFQARTATPSPRTTVSVETPTTASADPTTTPPTEPTTVAPPTTTPTTTPETSTTVPTTPTTRKRHHHGTGLLSGLLG